VTHEAEIDEAIEAWTSQHDYGEIARALETAEVPAGPIYNIADIAQDPQFQARGMFEQVTLPDGRALRIPAVVPKLSASPARTAWIGPKLGEHNTDVYPSLLGLRDADLRDLRREGVI
jgi:crotonobetainyl-CoA:carnitine CoA-transferase CaiB-like acyl-CoA transferase